MERRRRLVGILAAVASAAASSLATAGVPGFTTVDVIIADADATGYGTFQSHNQKVVSNRHGIFMAHLRSRNEPYTAQGWRVSRSTDGGKTFVSIFEGVHATNPAVLETDAAGNVYVARPDFSDGTVYLYRFHPANDFGPPDIGIIPNAASGKFAMAFDVSREQLYHFSHGGQFDVVGLDGKVRHTSRLLVHGENARLMYPLLSVADDGVVYAAWTTQKHGIYLYWDIHLMRSRDGGRSWERFDGRPLSIPFPADDTGPAERITLDDEFDHHTWLSNMMPRAGKLHLAYMTQNTPGREHYVRYDLATCKEDHRIQPEFKGREISLRNLDGFFAARASQPDTTLYFVSRNAADSRIGCLASDDNGRTWYDYAVSEQPWRPYAIGGCREITRNGDIIGSFTERLPDGTSDKIAPARVLFLKIQAGLAAAVVDDADFESGNASLHFSQIRGQPVQIRFRPEKGQWGPWKRFRPEFEQAGATRPAEYQLRSRLGVASDPHRIPWK